MKLPQPSAWRYTHRDYAENFVGYAYDTTKPKNCNHPNYVPMFTAGQMNQYGQACFKEGREACAKVAFDGYEQRLDGDEIGAAIRARGTT